MSLAAADALIGVFGMNRSVGQKKAKKPKQLSLPSLIRKSEAVTSIYVSNQAADATCNDKCV